MEYVIQWYRILKSSGTPIRDSELAVCCTKWLLGRAVDCATLFNESHSLSELVALRLHPNYLVDPIYGPWKLRETTTAPCLLPSPVGDNPFHKQEKLASCFYRVMFIIQTLLAPLPTLCRCLIAIRVTFWFRKCRRQRNSLGENVKNGKEMEKWLIWDDLVLAHKFDFRTIWEHLHTLSMSDGRGKSQTANLKLERLFGCCHSDVGRAACEWVGPEPHRSAYAARPSLDATADGYLGNDRSQHNLANQNIHALVLS